MAKTFGNLAFTINFLRINELIKRCINKNVFQYLSPKKRRGTFFNKARSK